MARRKTVFSLAVALGVSTLWWSFASLAQESGREIAPAPPVNATGVITTPSFELPFSSFASEEAKESFVRRLSAPMPIVENIQAMRELTDRRLEEQLELLKELYPYKSEKLVIIDVPVEVFEPKEGVAPHNKDRVLIQLHGGGFTAGGGGPGGAVESLPIAGEAGIRVVSVDYRLAPEHRFPAASEDVETVYRYLLETHAPENIGIYGCSAGGVLTGQSIAWFLDKELPLPGAIGIFCASTNTFQDGDSTQLWSRMGSVLRMVPPPEPTVNFPAYDLYHQGERTDNPLVVPSASDKVMSAFPPTLFLTGTRATEMSGAVQSHLQLRKLGVVSELLLFDGLDHGFYSDARLPESRDAYRLIAEFFMRHLGKVSSPSD